jgi:hypothetical protein
VDHGHDVESLGDGVGVSDLLIAPVALVVAVAEDGQRKVGVGVLVGSADVEGAIFRSVVDDQDFALVFLKDSGRNARQYLDQG